MQIEIAQMLSVLYSLGMMGVLVSIGIQVVEDGVDAPSSALFLSLMAVFFISAVIHPQEFYCIYSFILYFLLTPSMYLFLIIYSITSLNDVSWGTRDSNEVNKI